jgi:hypothetical protein
MMVKLKPGTVRGLDLGLSAFYEESFSRDD